MVASRLSYGFSITLVCNVTFVISMYIRDTVYQYLILIVKFSLSDLKNIIYYYRMSVDFDGQEVADGIRFNWNVFPSTRLEKSSLSTPVGCLFTPLNVPPQDKNPIPQIHGMPIRCDTCQAIMNRHAKVEYDDEMWWCPFCENRSLLPSNASSMNNQGEQPHPGRQIQDSNVTEYSLPYSISDSTSSNFPHAYIYIVDLYQHADEQEKTSFDFLIGTLKDSLEKIPKDSVFGLITFDSSVSLLNFDDKSPLVFNRDVFQVSDPEAIVTKKDNFNYSTLFAQGTIKRVIPSDHKLMRLSSQWENSFLVKEGFLMTLNDETKERAISKLNSLTPTITEHSKPDRCTGFALYIVSVILSKCSYDNFMGSISLFTSGPCTSEPGIIVDPLKRKPVRSHRDIVQLEVPSLLSSLKFYKVLSWIANGAVLDDSDTVNVLTKEQADIRVIESRPRWSFNLFSGSIDQVGIYEMKSLASNTMGKIHLLDSFQASQFAIALQRCINLSSFNCEVTSITSSGLKVSRMISNGFSISPSYESSEIDNKIGDEVTEFDSSSSRAFFTNRWICNTLSPGDTLAILFEPVVAKDSASAIKEIPKTSFIQFTVKYWHVAAKIWKLRVTTIKKCRTTDYPTPGSSKTSRTSGGGQTSKKKLIMEKELISGFDQKCWIVLLVRLLINKVDTALGYEKLDDLTQLIDRTTVRLMYHFQGAFNSSEVGGNANPYLNMMENVNDSLQLLPTYIHHLRRNPNLFRIFNSSPDETAYHHATFSRLDCSLSLAVVKPLLYNLTDSAVSLPLTDACFKAPKGSFLVMFDVYIAVILYITDNSTSLPLHPSDNEKSIAEHSSVFNAPLEFVRKSLVPPHVPPPRIIVTQTNHSQVRFLTSRLDKAEDGELSLSRSQLSSSKGLWSIFKPSKSDKKVNYKTIPKDDVSEDLYRELLLQAVRNYSVLDDF